jgi:hypothetical protein
MDGKRSAYVAVTGEPVVTYTRDTTARSCTVTTTGPVISGRHSQLIVTVKLYEAGPRSAHRWRAAASSFSGAVADVHAEGPVTIAAKARTMRERTPTRLGMFAPGCEERRMVTCVVLHMHGQCGLHEVSIDAAKG